MQLSNERINELRVAYLSNSTLPSRQANSVHVVNMAAAMVQNGCDVELWAYPDLSDNREMSAKEIADFYGVSPGFSLHYIRELNVPARSTLGALALAYSMRRRRDIDLVLGRHPKGCAFAALAGCRVLFETHQPVSWFPIVDRVLVRVAMACKAYIGIVTISQPLMDILREETGMQGDKFLVAHDGATVNQGIIAQVLGPAERLQVGYIGHLYPGRGVDVVVQLAHRLPSIDFHLIGGTEADINDWSGRISDLSNITLHGFVSPADASAMRLGCDVLLAPYQNDTSIPGGRVTTQWMSPLKVFEYMAAGKAIIASDLSVLREVLRPDENCLLVPPEDVDGWESAVRVLEEDSALRSRLGLVAQDDFDSHYTWQKRATNMVDFAVS